MKINLAWVPNALTLGNMLFGFLSIVYSSAGGLVTPQPYFMAGLLIIGAAILDALQGTRDDWLTVEQLEPLVRRRPESTLRAGFDGKNDHGSSSAGERCSPDTFGHLGFTGTSFWIDPHAQVVAVLLTNRVYPKRDNLTIQMARPTIHDELFAWGLRHAHRDGRKDADARRM